MAQYAPELLNLNVADHSRTWDRGVIFPSVEVPLQIQSVDVYLPAGASVRVGLFNALSAATINGAARIVDFGVVSNEGDTDGFITVSAPADTVFPASGYPAVVVRQNDIVALVGDEEFPVGDAVYATRSYNEDALYTDAFPSVAFDDDGASQNFRIPYVRLNFNEVSDGPTIESINDGQPVRAGSSFTFTVSEGFTPTSGTIGGIPVTDIEGTTPNFTATMPTVVEGEEHPGYGTKTAVFTDGVDSPETTVVYAPRTGYAVHTIGVNPDRSINGIGYLFDPELTQGDQIAAPSPAVSVGATGGAPGTSATAGTHLCEHISSVDGIVRFFELRVGA